MLDFIFRYWLQWLFGIIVAGLSFACRKFYKLYYNEKAREKDKEQDELSYELKTLIKKSMEISKEEDKKLQEQINTIKAGILSLQGRNFKQDCRTLLSESHIVLLEEFENLQADHSIYNSLGGNHDGDQLFEMVKEKAMRDITQ